ncbi:MAG: glycosyltransferase family A protein [Bacilli bacterium]|nr:glycosyltransferase family A protein [Bacilli bacterium]MDD4809244.1 glycosyltransferase family A protein [Bacilli bacterium]
MKLEVLLSVMNLNKKDLDKMNITSNCVVINQCDKEDYEEYKNFKIYSYNERGVAHSRNKALEKASEEIILFCDDDVVYNHDYEAIVLNEFKNHPKADMIFFNLYSPNRKIKNNNRNRRVRIYNALRYGTYTIAVRRKSLVKHNIKFNTLFGANVIYGSGEDTLLIVDSLKNKLKLYANTNYIGTVHQLKSSWFKGYNEKYFFDKGALFCAINKKIKYLLCLQYLISHRELLVDIKLKEAYRLMINGCKYYLSGKGYDEFIKHKMEV